MEIRVVTNNVYKGRKVHEIAKAGLEGKEDIILLFSKKRRKPSPNAGGDIRRYFGVS